MGVVFRDLSPNGLLTICIVIGVFPGFRIRPVLEVVQIIENLSLYYFLRLVFVFDHSLFQEGEKLRSFVFGKLPKKLFLIILIIICQFNSLSNTSNYIFNNSFQEN